MASLPNLEGDTMNYELITAEADNSGFCVVCGLDLDECPKHGPADRAGSKVLDAHDRGDHVGCNPKGCPLAGTVTGRAATGWAPPATTNAPPAEDVPRWATRVTAADFRGKSEPVKPEPVKPEPTSVVWEEPEEPTRYTWLDTVAELKEHPGNWAKVLVAPDRKDANRARNALRYHGAETKTKKTGDTVTVWAKWPTITKEDS